MEWDQRLILYTPLRVGFMDKEFMSDSSEVRSDLDGHTLSCSLELMSDI
jgi:hypothetical protein